MTFDNHAYIIGGTNTLDYTGGQNTNWDYTLVQSYTPRAPVPIALSETSAVYAGGHIYLFGGIDTVGNVLDAVWPYDVGADAWTSRSPMPAPPRAAAAVLYGDDIWVIGGARANGQPTGITEIYDPLGDAWYSGPSLLVPRHSLGAAVVGPWIFAVGGWTTTSVDTVEVAHQ